MIVKIECPYCGVINSRNFDLPTIRPQIECCDTEIGGCDRYFAVEVDFIPEIQTFTINKDSKCQS